MKAVLHKIGPFIGLVLFITAIWYLNHELRHYNIHEVLRQLSIIRLHRIFMALVLTASSYLALTGYDYLAFRYVKKDVPYARIGPASFIGYAFSNNIGLSLITGGSVRYRIYSSWGLSGLDITKIVAFCGLTLWCGFLFISGLTLLLFPPATSSPLSLTFIPLQTLGIIFISLIIGYLIASFFVKQPITVGNWQFTFPHPRIVTSQIVISSIDWTLSGAVLYVLLPVHNLGFLPFLSFYLLAQISGILSQIPGGLGVFESVMVMFLSSYAEASVVLGTLILFRLIYYLFPLLVAALFMAWEEVRIQQHQLGALTRRVAEWLPRIIPQTLSFSALIAGGVLLFSGATPAEITRLRWLNSFFPLTVIEISHFLSSITGVLLLILARGIQRRINTAYLLTITALVGGIVFSLLKGFDFEESIILSVILLAFIPCHSFFYRKASIFSQRFTIGWIITILLIVGSSVWLGYFSFHHLEYKDDLWWRFTLRGDAPRSLRALAGVLSVLLIYGFSRLLKASYMPKPVKVYEDKAHVRAVIMNSSHTYANLALTGDKSILFNETKNAFIMYAVEGRSWIAMGDPVGPGPSVDELLWNFRDECEYYDSWPVFYQVREQFTSRYIDLGLTLLKLGEEARVNLADFSLEGGERKVMRYHYHKIQKQGYAFDIVPVSEVPDIIDELNEISDQWLVSKNAREKGFSLGYFNRNYIMNFPCAVIRQAGEIVAFANLWMTGLKYELSLDLMRHAAGLPNGVMDYLFIELIRWGQDNGYQWLNLGMAPLSGVVPKDITPAWNKLASLIYRHGEYFYNFKGLRNYKEKFNPVWESRYLASPGGLALPGVLKNVTTLISKKPSKQLLVNSEQLTVSRNET